MSQAGPTTPEPPPPHMWGAAFGGGPSPNQTPPTGASPQQQPPNSGKPGMHWKEFSALAWDACLTATFFIAGVVQSPGANFILKLGRFVIGNLNLPPDELRRLMMDSASNAKRSFVLFGAARQGVPPAIADAAATQVAGHRREINISVGDGSATATSPPGRNDPEKVVIRE